MLSKEWPSLIAKNGRIMCLRVKIVWWDRLQVLVRKCPCLLNLLPFSYKTLQFQGYSGYTKAKLPHPICLLPTFQLSLLLASLEEIERIVESISFEAKTRKYKFFVFLIYVWFLKEAENVDKASISFPSILRYNYLG